MSRSDRGGLRAEVCHRSRQPPPNGARQSASQSLPAWSRPPNNPIQSLPPRGSCRAATEGEAPSRANLGRRTASPSAFGSSHSGEPPPNGARRSGAKACQPGVAPRTTRSNRSPRGGAVAQRLRGRLPAAPTWAAARPPPAAAPTRGSHRRTERADLGAKACQPGVAPRTTRSNRSPRGGAVAQRLRGRLPAPTWAAARPPPAAAPTRGSHRRTERADLGAKACSLESPSNRPPARRGEMPQAAPTRGSHRRTERADLGAKACQPAVPPEQPDPIAPPEGELSRSD